MKNIKKYKKKEYYLSKKLIQFLKNNFFVFEYRIHLKHIPEGSAKER